MGAGMSDTGEAVRFDRSTVEGRLAEVVEVEEVAGRRGS